jgi:hypothetical protein
MSSHTSSLAWRQNLDKRSKINIFRSINFKPRLMKLTAASSSRSFSMELVAIFQAKMMLEESCRVFRLISKLNFKLLRTSSRNKSISKDLLPSSMREEAVEYTTQPMEAPLTQPSSNKQMTLSRS